MPYKPFPMTYPEIGGTKTISHWKFRTGFAILDVVFPLVRPLMELETAVKKDCCPACFCPKCHHGEGTLVAGYSSLGTSWISTRKFITDYSGYLKPQVSKCNRISQKRMQDEAGLRQQETLGTWNWPQTLPAKSLDCDEKTYLVFQCVFSGDIPSSKGSLFASCWKIKTALLTECIIILVLTRDFNQLPLGRQCRLENDVVLCHAWQVAAIRVACAAGPEKCSIMCPSILPALDILDSVWRVFFHRLSKFWGPGVHRFWSS